MDENFSGRRIKEICDQKGVSVDGLARITGVTKSTICNIIKNNNAPNVNTIWRICDGVGITMSQFFKPVLNFEGEQAGDLSDQQKMLLEIAQNIPTEKLQPMIEYMRFMAEQNKKDRQ